MNASNHFGITEMPYSTIPIGYTALLGVYAVPSTALKSSPWQRDRSLEHLTPVQKI